MKKFGLIAMAMALAMTLSQCKKDDTTTSTNEGEKTFIRLNVGSNGSKHDVTPETGEVTFTNGDVIHVASNGVYVGTLEYNGTQFAGEINEPTEGEKLHFYFLGNQTPEFNTDNSQCSVIISDQTTKLPVISYNTSRENYQMGKTDYSATLLNKCALVKFDVTTSSTAATCIKGINNKVIVNFNPATEGARFGYNQDGEGIITIAAGNGERWAILLPQETTTPTAISFDKLYYGTCGTIQAIEENDYLTDGIAVVINTPMGAVNGLFSVSATKQVYFSKGNLQYQASTNIWQFAENQWDYIGESNINISQTYTGWIDLFGWGTSGWDCGNTFYHPWDSNNSSNGSLYGPPGNYEMNGPYANSDWGVYNPISNGGSEAGWWRTLSNSEWAYLLNSRSTISGIRYAKAQIAGTNGVILLPDDWNNNIFSLNNINISNASYNSNQITASQWSILESQGVVFLPAAGQRYGTSVNQVQYYGCYWSATGGMIGLAVLTLFHNSYLYPSDQHNRFYGNSVRLVQDKK